MPRDALDNLLSADGLTKIGVYSWANVMAAFNLGESLSVMFMSLLVHIREWLKFISVDLLMRPCLSLAPKFILSFEPSF